MWWGSLDPRISTREVARRLRLDPTTVWSRLRSWQRNGFLLGYSVVPNPTLFGAGLAGGSVRIADSRAKERFFRDLLSSKEPRLRLIKWVLGLRSCLFSSPTAACNDARV